MTRFPELCDVLQRCRAIEKRQAAYNPMGEPPPVDRLTAAEIVTIAEALGVEL